MHDTRVEAREERTTLASRDSGRGRGSGSNAREFNFSIGTGSFELGSYRVQNESGAEL